MEILFNLMLIISLLYLSAMYWAPTFFAVKFSTLTLETIEEWKLPQILLFCGELFFIVLLLIGLTTSQWALFLSVLLLRIMSDHSVPSTLKIYSIVSLFIFTEIILMLTISKHSWPLVSDFVINIFN